MIVFLAKKQKMLGKMPELFKSPEIKSKFESESKLKNSTIWLLLRAKYFFHYCNLFKWENKTIAHFHKIEKNLKLDFANTLIDSSERIKLRIIKKKTFIQACFKKKL
ncbi:hypothetical protein BpHYR1_009029 [Brachionus plicatilis]|uniref:Uncharacterized protein n=1 Tax=Brachionus plicatilis TaxID=10195 RepID=A0A3M7R337_BRAPC|nr:hypothetical protein BpHYR1_009029 [Brachionus plicatilis]